MAHTAIVAVEKNRVAKYQEFETQAEADAHVDKHGGFVIDTPAEPFDEWWIDENNNVTHVPDVAAKVTSALASIKTRHAEQLNIFTGSASVEERDTWPIQVAAAERYLADSNAADEAFLEGLLTSVETGAGATATDMANKIIAKSDLTKTLIQMAAKVKREAEQRMEAVTSQAEYDQAVTDLEAMEAQAAADFAALMS